MAENTPETTPIKNIVTLPKEQPKQIIAFGIEASKELMKIVRSNDWAVKISGHEYLRFEAWQTVGRFFNYTVKTKSTEYIELGKAEGFEATAVVLDASGQVVGGGEAMCMNDESNWKDKPLYALKSMAQTRASAKALRQVLAWVVVLAGYKPTPVEEIGAEVKDAIGKEPKKPAVAGKPNGQKCPDCGSVGKYHSPTCPSKDRTGEVEVASETEEMVQGAVDSGI